MARKPRKKQKVRLTEEQKKQRAEEQKIKRRASAYKRKIRLMFTGAGFTYLNTEGAHISIGRRVVEVDAVYFYENILLICEDTISKEKNKDHIRSKCEAFDEIINNFSTFLDYLCAKFPDNSYNLRRHNEERYQKFCLYFSLNELNLSRDEENMYSNIRFIEPKTLDYLNRMTQCIKLSAKYEFFRFLGIKDNQLGDINSGTTREEIQAPIIYPKETTGMQNGVRVVSFMMSAEHLLKTCYVLRKDNWEESIWLYQRLIDKNKIKNIREFLANRSEAFFSNVIVALPDNVHFIDAESNPRIIDDLSDFEQCSIVLPHDLNSICVIDGQHRIFAHYEGSTNDKNEEKIALLRKRLHLLVTGLKFPSNMPQSERIKIQSQIFLDINDNAKAVPPDVLLHIAMNRDPFSDVGIARRVVERLNKETLFLNKFEMSSLDESKIKIASIIKFALRYLVTISPIDDRKSLFSCWAGDKAAIERKEDQALDEYIDFCVQCILHYFAAVKNNNMQAWNDPESKLLSVIAINGFIIALTRQLAVYGVKDYAFYNNKLTSFSMDYSKSNFEYTSSQYRKFSDRILSEAFGLDVLQV